MKNKFHSSSRYQFTVRGLLLGCVWLLLSSASAQNLLQNPGFESPIDPWDPLGLSGGTTNWTIVYASGGPCDFAMKDRSRSAARSGGSYGAALRPATEWWCHAYFTQTVSNLTANTNYVFTGWINKPWLQNAKCHLYIEMLGGPAGTTSVVSPDVAAAGWIQYSVTNTASTAGTLEVRLHMNKEQTPLKQPGLALYYVFDGWFDDFTLTAQ